MAARALVAPEIIGVFPDTGASNLDQVTSADFLIVFGRARAGAAVEVLVGSAVRALASAGTDGSWHALLDPASFPNDGAYDLQVREIGGSASAPFRMMLDRAPPPAALVFSVGDDAAGPYETASPLPPIRVLLPPGENAVLSASIDGEPANVAADASGWWITPTAPLQLGAHILQVAATDIAGNVSVTVTDFSVVDATPPTMTGVTLPTAGVRRAGDQLVFVIHLSEAVQLDSTPGPLPYLEVTAGTQRLMAGLLLEGGSTEAYFGLAVPGGAVDLDGIVLNRVIFAGPAIRDAAGLAWDGVVGQAAPTVRIDAQAPMAWLEPASILAGIGTALRIDLIASEPVFVAPGSMPIALSIGIGGSVREAAFVAAASTPTRLAFELAVVEGELDGDGVAIGTLDDTGGRLTDAAGNPLTFDGAGMTMVGLRVDGVAPTAQLIDAPAAAARLGDTLNFAVATSEPVLLRPGLEQFGLSLDVGGVPHIALIDEGASTATRLVFRWTVEPGDLDVDGIMIGSLWDPGARLVDPAGNRLAFEANLGLPDVTVDGVVPVASLHATGGTITSGGEATFTLQLSEPVSLGSAGGDIGLALTVGRRSAMASLDPALSSPTTLVFTYTPRPGDFDADGVAVGALIDSGARLLDASGNRLHFDGAGGPAGPQVALPAHVARWRKSDTSLVEWKVEGIADVTASPAAAVAGWVPVMTAQVDGRSGVDTIWRSTAGQLYAWLDAPPGAFEGRDLGSAGSGWEVAAAGDLDGDGTDELLWLGHQSWYVWQLGGARAMGGGGLGHGWTPAVLADFGGTGRDDILWRHTDGGLFLWEMQGPTFVRGAPVGTVGAEWRIAGAADYSGDGKSDLIFQHSGSGDVWGWRMDGASVLGWEWLASAGPAWTVVGADSLGGAAAVHLYSAAGHVWRWILSDGQVTDSRPLGTISDAVLL